MEAKEQQKVWVIYHQIFRGSIVKIHAICVKQERAQQELAKLLADINLVGTYWVDSVPFLDE